MRTPRPILVLALALALPGCGRDLGVTLQEGVCDLDPSLLANGGPGPDGIPALTLPEEVAPGDEGAAYLEDADRVLGVVVDGVARAYPHNTLWWHEIVNDTVAGRYVAVTFCPLTGSGVALDARILDFPIEFGVSGLLYANNLVMFDRISGRLYGPQLEIVGRCHDFQGAEPTLVPVVETSWGRWRELHPDTRVVSSRTGYARNYRLYPYGDYDDPDNPVTLFPQDVDRTRPPKERVLGIRAGSRGGKGYPFGELARLGPVAAVNDEVGGRPVVVLYEARDGGTAVAFDRRVGGRALTFEAAGPHFRDRETGTLWDLAGRGLEGPLAGARLDPVPEAYVVFWFAWRFFQPDARTFPP